MSSESKDLGELRRTLHRLAEPSGEESETAAALAERLRGVGCGELRAGLGGHGLALVHDGAAAGPTVLVRAELDALPIPDTPSLPHASCKPGYSHKCGHDGHMAMLAGVADRLARRPIERGRAVLLFQPAEETGQGARMVLDDPAFATLRPDRVLALHNLPGFPLGAVILRNGAFACASRGIAVRLTGASSHAAQPEAGRSPAPAVAQLILDWSALPQFHTGLGQAAQVTVIHARVGERAFGTSPGQGAVMATLRAEEDAVLERLAALCEARARGLAAAHGLRMGLEWVEPFPTVTNDAAVNDEVAAAAESLGLDVLRAERPFPWSEDFGQFTAAYPGALLGLGAGESQPALHHPDYDFPDALLETGADLLEGALRRLLLSATAKGAPRP